MSKWHFLAGALCLNSVRRPFRFRIYRFVTMIRITSTWNGVERNGVCKCRNESDLTPCFYFLNTNESFSCYILHVFRLFLASSSRRDLWRVTHSKNCYLYVSGQGLSQRLQSRLCQHFETISQRSIETGQTLPPRSRMRV